MKVKELSITFHTDKVKECVEFYCEHFGATITFDCGWYVLIRLESNHEVSSILGFQNNSYGEIQNTFRGGTTLNLLTENVDSCYEQLKQTELSFVEDITNHDWGDRAFSLLDPIGNLVYVYSIREIGEEYKEAVK